MEFCSVDALVEYNFIPSNPAGGYTINGDRETFQLYKTLL
jgi:hypothetical protein